MVWRLRAVTTGLAGAPYLSTFHLAEDEVATPADAVTAIRAFFTNIQDRVDNALSTQVLGEVAVMSTPDTVTSVIGVSGGAPVAGNSSGLISPRATQGLLRWRTGIYVGGREIRGRTFIPGVTSLDVSASGGPTESYRTALETAGSILMGQGLMVASRKNNLFYEAQSASCWTEFAVLRGRRD